MDKVRPSKRTLVPYEIVENPPISTINRLLICYGHPEDGPAELILRDPQDDIRVSVTCIDSLEEDPETGHLHFAGELEDGLRISGSVRSGTANGIVGKATIIA